MATLLDQKTAIRLLTDVGYRRTIGGKHSVKMVARHRRPITLPRHQGQVYGKQLTHSIIKQAGLTAQEVERWKSRSRSTTNRTASGQRSTSSRDASPPAQR